MNFSSIDIVPNRQRGRQWIPLITQQFRLRHLSQLIGLNLTSKTFGSFYYTLHSTTMSAPFYTSEKIQNPNPRWKELDFIEMTNTSASCIVVRVWHHGVNESDQVVLTLGIHLSGLVYLGSKIADIQPLHVKANTVIFCIFGGYYTSLNFIKFSQEKSIPFLNNLNAIDTHNDKVIFKRVAVKCHLSEIQTSYNVDKLKKVQYLQREIKRKSLEVQSIQEKIHVFLSGNNMGRRENLPKETDTKSPIRYAPQLLTMNSLHKMLQEKPTTVERQQMFKIKKQIEVIKFKAKLLSQEKDKISVIIRQLKQNYVSILDTNEERNTILMENYHQLAKGTDKLKEYKNDINYRKDILSQLYYQLQHRKKQLLQELLLIYPIKQVDGNKYTIYGIYFPNSDKLADSPDIGLSVALGYIAHILTMCSTFLQVPLRYPLTHYGSRSYITDHISLSLSDKEREFHLFTRGKDKVQFTYAVYLLNKNIAQLRWLLSINTHDLKATLANLLSLLQIQKDYSHEFRRHEIPLNKKITFNFTVGKYVGLHSFGSNSSISDPILDWLRYDNHLQKLRSPTRIEIKKSATKQHRSCETGRGLTEILTIPEAYLNKQISSDSLRNFMISGKCYIQQDQEHTSNGNTPSRYSEDEIIVTSGKEIGIICNSTMDKHQIEEGTDTLDPRSNLSSLTKPLLICDNHLRKKYEDGLLRQNRRLSRSVGSYSDEEYDGFSKPSSESDPVLNSSSQSEKQILDCVLLEHSQKRIIPKWFADTPCSSTENICSSDISSNASPNQTNPLTLRTDALLTRKTFNLVKPKP